MYATNFIIYYCVHQNTRINLFADNTFLNLVIKYVGWLQPVITLEYSLFSHKVDG